MPWPVGAPGSKDVFLGLKKPRGRSLPDLWEALSKLGFELEGVGEAKCWLEVKL